MTEEEIIKDEKEYNEKINKLKEILSKHNIKMSVGGCGCCGSPWFKFEYKGEIVVDCLEEGNFDMFKEE